MLWSSIYKSMLSIFLDSNKGFVTTLLKGESEEQETSAMKKQPFGNGFMKGPEYTTTPLKFNIAPEKWWLEDYFPIGKVAFQGLC